MSHLGVLCSLEGPRNGSTNGTDFLGHDVFYEESGGEGLDWTLFALVAAPAACLALLLAGSCLLARTRYRREIGERWQRRRSSTNQQPEQEAELYNNDWTVKLVEDEEQREMSFCR